MVRSKLKFAFFNEQTFLQFSLHGQLYNPECDLLRLDSEEMEKEHSFAAAIIFA